MKNRTTLKIEGVGPRQVCVAWVAAVSAAALLTGCGSAVGSDPVGSGGEARPAAALSCPVLDPAVPQAPPTLIDGTPANTPEAQRLSQAIGAQGDGAFADVYSTQITDHPAGRVALCVTDAVRGRLLVEAAHAADPGADPARADVYVSPYSRRTLDAAADKIIALKADFPVYSVSGGHGSSVEVTTSQEGVRSAEFKERLEKAAGGVPVTVRKGEAAQPLVGDMPRSPAP
ncbi:hypothetical protein J7F03_11540 [Streptomyces sp. ISL-43]|uniref:hypothetical protein n=1 Tax=Streptomyces sp. ISL-43 TaxID=2819183 RepID=UPI001BEB09CD|nr:hypothetical protein [Streptomyces sp. ISL-43]MBT2447697.1 hypothetical protein [Streptomyces sp. ISL-43]